MCMYVYIYIYIYIHAKCTEPSRFCSRDVKISERAFLHLERDAASS